MAYKPNFKWNDELVSEFAKLCILGTNNMYEDTRTVEEKLIKFKELIEKKKRDERVKRVLVGKRGMNEDGSRFYYDTRGIKWIIKREELDNETYYIAESNKNEAIRTKFLSDIYFDIDKKCETELSKIAENNLKEILN